VILIGALAKGSASLCYGSSGGSAIKAIMQDVGRGEAENGGTPRRGVARKAAENLPQSTSV
jgi:hypothetical protein